MAPVLGQFPVIDIANAQSAEPAWRHALSLFGDIKYPADFKRFDYVNPDAPKGGVARLISLGTFDNFNIAVAGIKGNIAAAATQIYETLMAKSQDEIVTEYGLLAEAAAHPDDFSWVIYRLRKEARWHDGKPVTPEDVMFSLETLKKLSPFYAAYYRHVVKAEKSGERDIKFTFDVPGNRELPTIVGEVPVLPKHYWEGTDDQGRKRDISLTTLEKPLGSGPYRIKEFVAGRSVVLERVKDYWGANLPVRIGQNNFDEMRFEYYRDNNVALEAFKADQADWIAENSAKQWATAYEFPAVVDKRVLKEEFPVTDSGRMQGFAFNLRREMFRDVRLRRAFNYAYDFEEMNKQLFYGMYKRINSYFEGRNRSCLLGTSARAGIAASRSGKGQGAAGSLHHALHQPGRRQSRECPQQSARGIEAAQGSRLRGQGPQAGGPVRQAGYGRDTGAGSLRRAYRAVLQALAGAHRCHRLDPRRRRRAIREPYPQLRFRHDHRRVGPVAVARQRAA
ncbi:hypothetical protein ES707_11426 [subsurface metagenome]